MAHFTSKSSTNSSYSNWLPVVLTVITLVSGTVGKWLYDEAKQADEEKSKNKVQPFTLNLGEIQAQVKADSLNPGSVPDFTLKTGTVGGWLSPQLRDLPNPAVLGDKTTEVLPINPLKEKSSISDWFNQTKQFAQRLYHAFHDATRMLVYDDTDYSDHGNIFLEIGRWTGLLALLSTSLLVFWKQLRKFLRGLTLPWSRQHIVLCGFGERARSVALQYRSKTPQQKIIAIDLQPTEAIEDLADEHRIHLLRGDASKEKTLLEARVLQAREVVVLTAQDETNMRIASALHLLAKEKGVPPPPCFVNLGNLNLLEALQRAQPWQSGDHIQYFDLFDNEARRLLLHLPLDGNGIPHHSPVAVQMVVIGFGQMGQSLTLRAAKMGHFANQKKLRITVIDEQMERKRRQFYFRHPMLAENDICELSFHHQEPDSDLTIKELEKLAQEPDTLLHVFVCLEQDALTVEVGLRLAERLRHYRSEAHKNCRILLHLWAPGSVEAFIQPQSGHRLLSTFGVVSDVCDIDNFRHEENESLARAIHTLFVKGKLQKELPAPFVNEGETKEVPRGQSQARPEFTTDELALMKQKNDPALRPWKDLRTDFRESNRQQADLMAIKLRAVGCRLVPCTEDGEAVTSFSKEEVEIMAHMEHRRWNAQRWLEGWRYAEKTNKDLRLSEYLVDWEQLDDDIQEYDRQPARNIPQLLLTMQVPHKVVRLSTTTDSTSQL